MQQKKFWDTFGTCNVLLWQQIRKPLRVPLATGLFVAWAYLFVVVSDRMGVGIPALLTSLVTPGLLYSISILSVWDDVTRQYPES